MRSQCAGIYNCGGIGRGWRHCKHDLKERFQRKLDKEKSKGSAGSSMPASEAKGKQKEKAGKDVDALISKLESLPEAKAAGGSGSGSNNGMVGIAVADPHTM
eukprot:scaffold329253_cov35-Prasinocladus_malaysianus.AAC.1